MHSAYGATLNSLDLERKKTAFASNGRPEPGRGDPPQGNTSEMRCTIWTRSDGIHSQSKERWSEPARPAAAAWPKPTDRGGEDVGNRQDSVLDISRYAPL